MHPTGFQISYREVGLLALAQAMLMTGTSLLISTSALVGRNLSADPALATIPLGLQFLAMTLSTIPASLFMGRYGRRAGFLIGVSLGIVGTLLAGFAVFMGSFVLFCVAAVLLGSFNATGQFYRFAAAEVASEALRARAIGLVLAGGIVAAFMGPNLAAWTRHLAGPEFAASYLILAGLYLVGLAAILPLRIPHAGAGETALDGSTRARDRRQPGVCDGRDRRNGGLWGDEPADGGHAAVDGRAPPWVRGCRLRDPVACGRDVPAVVFHRRPDPALWPASDPHGGRATESRLRGREFPRPRGGPLLARPGAARHRLEFPVHRRHDAADPGLPSGGKGQDPGAERLHRVRGGRSWKC
jgi:hypothetical protein